MIRQSRNIGLTTLQTQFVTGGSYVTIATSGVSAPLGLSLIYIPSQIGVEVEVELSVLIDGTIKTGADTHARGDVWRNGVPWKSFGSVSGFTGFTDGIYWGGQMNATLRDIIPANSTQIIYSLYGTCFKGGASSPSSGVAFNWGLNAPLSAGGGTTASFIRLVERTRP